MNYSFTERRPADMTLLGLPFHQVGVEEIHAWIQSVISRDEKAIVLNLNIHGVFLALKNAWYHEMIQKTQLVFCDGDGVRWGLKLMGFPPPPKVTTARWLWQLAEFCEKQQYSFYFLGGRPGVPEEAARQLKGRYPGLKVVGFHDNEFDKEGGAENEKIIAEINRLKPDILIVAFGQPVQEKWVLENWEKLDAHVFTTAGAAFEYVAGRIAVTPPWMIRLNLEWFFRLCQEPRRLWKRYCIEIPYFFAHVFREKWRQLLRGEKK